MNRTKKGQVGLSLLEVLTASALLTLTVLSVWPVFGSALAWNQDAADRTRSALEAVEVIESLKDQPELIRPVTCVTPDTLGLTRPDAEQGDVTISIREYDISLGLYLVEVRCGWEKRGSLQQEGLTALIRGGI